MDEVHPDEEKARKLFMDRQAWTAAGNGSLTRSIESVPSFFSILRLTENTYQVKADLFDEIDHFSETFPTEEAAMTYAWRYFKARLILRKLTEK